MEDEENDGAPVNEDGETDAGVPGYRTVRPCSVGLTFAADADATVVILPRHATARYVPEEREVPEGGQARAITGGACRSATATRCRRAGKGRGRRRSFRDADGAQVCDPEVRLHIQAADRRRPAGGHGDSCQRGRRTGRQAPGRVLPVPDGARSSDAVDRGGAGAIRPRPAVLSASDDEDARSAALLYRDVVEYAVGHGVAAEWEVGARERRGPGRDHVAAVGEGEGYERGGASDAGRIP